MTALTNGFFKLLMLGVALVNCEECEEQVSDRAESCQRCGCPVNTKDKTERPGIWRAVVRSKTPINIFALAMMACAAVFGASATGLDEGERLIGFTYALHVFLAVAGMFFVCILFAPRSIYHPDDLIKATEKGVDLGPNRPVIAAVLIGVMLVLYGLYQIFESALLKRLLD